MAPDLAAGRASPGGRGDRLTGPARDGTEHRDERVFATVPFVADVADLVEHCRANLEPEEAERLVGWLAWRTGRNQALAGDGPPFERLERAVVRWLGDEERTLLLEWMRRRRGLGLGQVPR